MSVFTPLERHQLEVFLAPYGLGRLRDFQGIAAGSENSNFFVSLEQGEYVLTLVERGPVADLPFFIELLDVLHDAGLPVPYALRTQDGEQVLKESVPVLAGEVMERMRRELADVRSPLAPGLRLSLSIGLAGYSPFHLDASHWLKAADQALYRAKRGGRNRCEFAATDQ